MSQSLGTALVTGASSGIGAVYAERLAHRGYDLVLVARSDERLNSIAQTLRNETGRTVNTIKADLTKPEDVRMIERVLRDDASINVLVNNAGKGSTAPVVDSDPDAMEDMIDLNVTAVTRLAIAAAAVFPDRPQSAIINIASIAAIAPEILNAVYSGSKAFVLAFSQVLHKELGEKVRIQAVLPGATATDFWDAAGISVGHLPEEIVMRTNDMVDASLIGFDRGELVTIPALPDETQWQAYEGARQAMMPNLSRTVPADRYLAKEPA